MNAQHDSRDITVAARLRVAEWESLGKRLHAPGCKDRRSFTDDVMRALICGSDRFKRAGPDAGFVLDSADPARYVKMKSLAFVLAHLNAVTCVACTIAWSN
jgi:hypothetical protein